MLAATNGTHTPPWVTLPPIAILDTVFNLAQRR